MAILFRRTKQLEFRIDEFLDAISQGAILFRCGIQEYFDRSPRFPERLTALHELEETADELRKNVEAELYRYSLIPEHRGDVLGLLEHLDDVIDAAKHALDQFSIESPEVPPTLFTHFLNLVAASADATESVTMAARSFFRDPRTVKDHLHKVKFYEREADRLEDVLKRQVFHLDLELSRKIQLSYFAKHIGMVSDAAEDAADRLAISSIKRSV
jgi:predicted phosphate transport protein (TIGR00153 family)